MKAELRASENYLFTIKEASSLMRMNYAKFVTNYIDTGLIRFVLLEDGRKMIRQSEISSYMEDKTYVKYIPGKYKRDLALIDDKGNICS
jgi:predicted site-specific integrase-resolvase